MITKETIHQIYPNIEEIHDIDYGNEAGFNAPLMDIAKSIINDSRFGIKVYDAYYDVHKFDKEAMKSFLYIISLRKIVSWKKRGKEDRVGLLVKLLEQVGSISSSNYSYMQ